MVDEDEGREEAGDCRGGGGVTPVGRQWWGNGVMESALSPQFRLLRTRHIIPHHSQLRYHNPTLASLEVGLYVDAHGPGRRYLFIYMLSRVTGRRENSID